MKRAIALIPLILLAVALPALDGASVVTSSEAIVRFAEGWPEVRSEGDWALLESGMVLLPADTIRLEPGDYVEIESGTDVVRLSRPGDYRVDSLLASTARARSTGTDAFLAVRVARLLGRAHEVPQTVAMGVRGAGDDGAANEAILTATELMGEGEHAAAGELLRGAYGELEDRRYLPSIAFLIGANSFLAGEVDEAVEWLDLVGPDPRTDFFRDHSVLLAQLLIDQYAFDDAQAVLEDLVAFTPEAMDEPDVVLMLIVTLVETGGREEAAGLLERLPSGEHRAVAERLLQDVREDPAQ